MSSNPKLRVLVFIVAYNAERTISSVVKRIPATLKQTCDLDVLIIDDASVDKTFERSHILSKTADLPFDLHVLFNPVNQGYGGNQKIGYHYAIERNYDCVVLLHGDGQYAPESLPELLAPFARGHKGAVFGSRMLSRMGALKGGMPLYKFVGNKILTKIENTLLGTKLSEFHSGYRLYSVEALKAVPFDQNSNGFDFDTEIIIQMVAAKQPILELPIPTYYGDEICHVNGIKYAAQVIAAVLKFRLQQMSLFYDVRFDCAPEDSASPYKPKLSYTSTHTLALQYVHPNSTVVDLGCAAGYVGQSLREHKQCYVTGVDAKPPAEGALDGFCSHDLNNGLPDLRFEDYDYTLLLDVIEHLYAPGEFLTDLRQAVARNPRSQILISTGNVAFIVVRMMLLLGQFNYGKRGILDLTHHRLFTFASMRQALEQAGFDILETRGVPAPFPLAVGENMLGQFLVACNSLLIRLLPGLFSYQMFMRIKPRPSLEVLLRSAYDHSAVRVRDMESYPIPHASAREF